MFDQQHLYQMKEGLELYNSEKFWECHEVLEDLWADYSHSSVKYVSWAIIQVATSLYHVRNQNIAGAHGMLKKAKEKILQCEKLKVENELLEKSLSWSTFKHLVFAIKESDNLEAFFNLYKFKFPGVS
jgi:uncharacterized protein